MKEFDTEEIERFDGKDGKPAYVLHRGKVYDVTGSNLWKGGVHMNRHRAGNDLTDDIQAAPHDPGVLERYPQVGTIKQGEISERQLPEVLSWILARAPYTRRHLHPMTIHFPIAFTFAALVFNALYLFLGIKEFEITALHSLGAAILFTPVAMVTGFFTWWLNYQAKPIRPVVIKQRLSFLVLAIEVTVFLWRLRNPAILDSSGWSSMIYLLLILIMFIAVFVIGWFGAGLTFPIEKPATRRRTSER